MTRFTRLCRAVGVSLAVAAATLSMTQAAHAELPTPTVPDPVIAAPAGNEVFLVGHATGKQIYTCNGNGSWGTAVPQADLYDNGKLIIKHFAGPTWQEVPDGSSVVGAKVNNGVSPDPNAIPWLLLKATKTTAGRGGHLLSDTTYIQRLHTTGGLPPAPAKDTCTATTDPKVVGVDYTADYYFYKATSG
jgi:hypothetical protein